MIFTDLLDGPQDDVYADPMLLNAYGIVVEMTSESQSSRVIVLNSTAYEGNTPTTFEEVHLTSLEYDIVESTRILKDRSLEEPTACMTENIHQKIIISIVKVSDN